MNVVTLNLTCGWSTAAAITSRIILFDPMLVNWSSHGIVDKIGEHLDGTFSFHVALFVIDNRVVNLVRKRNALIMTSVVSNAV